MVITDDIVHVDRTPPDTSPRRPARWRTRGLATAVAAVVVAGAASVALVESSGPPRSDQEPVPASRTRDDVVRDLVARGVVTAATLHDGTQITSAAPVPASRTRDDVVRDLVARGVVPAATLDDGTQITSPALGG